MAKRNRIAEHEGRIPEKKPDVSAIPPPSHSGATSPGLNEIPGYVPKTPTYVPPGDLTSYDGPITHGRGGASPSSSHQDVLQSALRFLSSGQQMVLPYDIKASQETGIPVSVLLAQQNQESGYDPDAESPTGAFGISQFEPETAEGYGVERGDSPKAIWSQVKGEADLLKDDDFAHDPEGALGDYYGEETPEYGGAILAAAQRLQEQGVDKTTSGGGSSIPTGGHMSPAVKRELNLVEQGDFEKGPGDLVLNHSVHDSTVGHEKQIAARLKLLSAHIGEPVYDESPYRTPAYSVSVGGYADDPHTKAEAADIGIGSGLRESAGSIPEKDYNAVGLYRPEPDNPAEVNHVQLIGQRSSSTDPWATGGSGIPVGTSGLSGTSTPTISGVSSLPAIPGSSATLGGDAAASQAAKSEPGEGKLGGLMEFLGSSAPDVTDPDKTILEDEEDNPINLALKRRVGL